MRCGRGARAGRCSSCCARTPRSPAGWARQRLGRAVRPRPPLAHVDLIFARVFGAGGNAPERCCLAVATLLAGHGRGACRDAAGSGAGGQAGAAGGRRSSRSACWRRWPAATTGSIWRRPPSSRTAGSCALALPEAVPAVATLEQWSDGPLVAGYGTTYRVLIVDERICGEALVAPLDDRVHPTAGPVARTAGGAPCRIWRRAPWKAAARPGFAAYAREGFPLMIGERRTPYFQVRQLRFDHYPAEPAPALP